MTKEFYGDFKETDQILHEVLKALKEFGLIVEPDDIYHGSDTISFTISDGKP